MRSLHAPCKSWRNKSLKSGWFQIPGSSHVLIICLLLQSPVKLLCASSCRPSPLKIPFTWKMSQFRSFQVLSRVQLFVTHGLQQTRRPCPSPTAEVYSNSCPLSRWCHPTISSSVVPYSSCPQSFPASGSLQMSQLFASGDQSTGVSASTSVLLMNIRDWFPLGLTGWISLQSKGLSRVFSNTTVQKHQFFGAQLSL